MSGPLAQKVRAKYPGAYDDLSDEQLEQAVTRKYPGVYDDLIEEPQNQTTTERRLHPHAKVAREVGNVVKGGVNVLKSIPEALFGETGLVTNLAGALGAVGEAQGRVGVGAKEAYDQGDYLTAARKGVNYLIPVLGPAMDASADKMMQGDISEGMGEVATNALLTAYSGRPRTSMTVARPPRVTPPRNPLEARAVQFAKQEGIPLDAATASGSDFLRKVQKKVESSYGGYSTADDLRQSQAQNLTRVGEQQATNAGPVATNPVAAGESVRNALTKQIQALHTKASGAYNVLREMEQAQLNAMPKKPKVLAQMDVMQRTPLAVDITSAVKQFEPLYTQLKRESELGIPMHGAKGRTLAALDGLMNSPNVAPLSVVDGALSDLKALARGAEMPELRTTGQASAAQAVQALDTQVRAAAAKAGPSILRALEEGRAATTQKYAVADVLDMLSGEPGQVFRQLTQNKDVGLVRLKAVQKMAPGEVPNVARAFLEDMMQQATTEGGFLHADRLWANWQKLGSQTKQTLFPKKGQIQDLDNFFLIAKRIKDNPNPSGTATIPGLNATEVLAGIPAWALSKMLMTPNGVKWLTDARIVNKSRSPSARALALSNVSKAAQSAGVPFEAIPAFAEGDQQSMRSGKGQR